MSPCCCGHTKDEHELGMDLCLVEGCLCGWFHAADRAYTVISYESIMDVTGKYLGVLRTEKTEIERGK